MNRNRILIVYYAALYPLRTTIWDHLYSFQRYGRSKVVHVNLAVRKVPKSLKRYNAIILHTTMLSLRWDPQKFRTIIGRVKHIADFPGPKVALPQDEFIHTDSLAESLHALGVTHIRSVAKPSEWPKIYGDLVHQAKFTQDLTGYLDELTLRRIDRHMRRHATRPIDISYRAWQAQAWLGRHGLLKTSIAHAFAQQTPRHGLRADVSLREEDTLHGFDWYRFLMHSRWTIGVEGGATILDRDGSVRNETVAYVARHPDAEFDEVEAACFPGRDGELDLRQLSPRQLEACATKTGQILVRGNYNGVLKEGLHYLALEPDFSNLDELLEQSKDEETRVRMTEQAYRDVVASGAYSCRTWIENIEKELLGVIPVKKKTYRRIPLHELTSWLRVILFYKILGRVEQIIGRRAPRWAKQIAKRLRSEPTP